MEKTRGLICTLFRSVLHGQVSLAAVNQICVIYEAMSSCKNLKDCFENVNIKNILVASHSSLSLGRAPVSVSN